MSSSPALPVSRKLSDKSIELQNLKSQQPSSEQCSDSIVLTGLISEAKFSVHKAFSPAKNTTFALKVFELENGKPHKYFQNEIRFAHLSHPNIIKTVSFERKTSMLLKSKETEVSCLMMEYAPYGDFFDLVSKQKQFFTDKLIRTYFRQLIGALEYLHSKKVCHLDLKLENILLGDKYQMKLADFDLSYIEGDKSILTRGTKFYRAPELLNNRCRDGALADVYAAGVILFVLKSGGIIPHAEATLYKGVDLLKLLNDNDKDFFRTHCRIQGKKDSFYDEEFKELFVSMTKIDPRKRATLDNIKSSSWYNGEFYTNEELTTHMERILKN